MTPEEARERLREEREVCSSYIASAKTYAQLSTAALVLSVAFARDLLGDQNGVLLADRRMLAAWVLWLLAVFCSGAYEYIVIKYLEAIADEQNLLYYKRNWFTLVPKKLADNPFWLFGAMLVFFNGGLLVFTWVAVSRLLRV